MQNVNAIVISQIVGLLLSAVSAFGSGLTPPVGFDGTATLPKGVRVLRMGGVSTEVSQKFDGGGELGSLAYSFNRPVTFGDLEKSLPRTPENAVIIGAIDSQRDPNEVAGIANGDVNARVTTTIPAIAYGITDKFMVGMGVPILYANWSTSVGWSDSNVTSVGNGFIAQGSGSKLPSIEQKLVNVVNQKIADYGYKPLVGENRTDLGDMNLIAKYQMYQDRNWIVAISPKIVVPTGRVADPDKVIDIAPGDGQFDVGIGGVVDRLLTSKLTLTSSTYYTYQAPSQKTKRIPLDWSSTLSPDVDPSTNEKYGDLMGTSLALRYQFHPLWTAGTAASLQYKAPDTYSGSKYAQERYNVLSRDTEQVMHAVEVGVSFSTVPLYKAKRFEVPLDLSLGYSSVIGGRNVNKMDLATLELTSFF